MTGARLRARLKAAEGRAAPPESELPKVIEFVSPETGEIGGRLSIVRQGPAAQQTDGRDA